MKAGLLFYIIVTASGWSVPPLRLQPITSRHASSSSEELVKAASRLREDAAKLQVDIPEPSINEALSETPSEDDVAVPTMWFDLAGSCWKVSMTINGLKEQRDSLASVQLSVDIGLEPPRDEGAPVRVFGSSKYIKRGYAWKVSSGEEDDPEDDSFYLVFNVRAEGLEPLVPNGSLYVNARIEREKSTGSLTLCDGVLTCKVPQKAQFLWINYDGLLAEYKVIGECAITPVPPPTIAPS